MANEQGHNFISGRGKIVVIGSLLSFIVAGITGVWMRATVLGVELPFGSAWEHVRHAHSHLMFFSWITPMLMLAIGYGIRRNGGRLRTLEANAFAAVVFGLCSFLPFALSGYSPTKIGDRGVPLSVIFSTVSMFTWYIFCVEVIRARRHIAPQSRFLTLVAVGALGLSTLGAWLRGYYAATGEVDRFLTDGSVHAFVTTFSVGWVLLGTIAVLQNRFVPAPRLTRVQSVANLGVVLSLPGVWILSVREVFVPETIWTLGAVCSWVFGMSLFTYAGFLSRRTERWNWMLIAVLGLSQAMASLPGVMAWIDFSYLRVPFIHTLFLAFASAILVEILTGWLGLSAFFSRLFKVAATLLIVGLLPTTTLLPNLFRTAADPWIVVVTGALPPAVIAFIVISIVFRKTEPFTDGGGSSAFR